MDGSLHETDINTRSSGFLSFIRLIGTIYYKKHLPSFISLDGHETPEQSFNAIDKSLQTQHRHRKWLDRIRTVVADRIKYEEERVPSFTSLWRHWLRSCWTATL